MKAVVLDNSLVYQQLDLVSSSTTHSVLEWHREFGSMVQAWGLHRSCVGKLQTSDSKRGRSLDCMQPTGMNGMLNSNNTFVVGRFSTESRNDGLAAVLAAEEAAYKHHN